MWQTAGQARDRLARRSVSVVQAGGCLKSLVAVSGYVDQKHRQQAADAGFDEFLGEPYTADELLNLFDRLQPKYLAAKRLPG